jgi:GNAT superfamily N-acetyltransferase
LDHGHPPRHGTGLAVALMEACLAWAAPVGYRSICLQVWEEKPRAIRFYTRQGFQDQGATTFQVGTQVYHDLIMSRAL